jgi:hypothetical protein
MKFKSAALYILTSLVIISCGKKDEEKKGSGTDREGLTLSPFEQISTEWSGSYKALNEGESFGEVSFVTANFSASNEFVMTVDGDASGKVEGRWSEFQGKNLILRITGSNISRIGSAGKIVEPLYELTGQSLRISSPNFEMKLTRQSSAETGQSPGSKPSFFSGSWICDDGRNRKTKILIDDSTNYQLSSLRQPERAFTAQGKTNLISSDILKLTADITSDAVAPGSYFELHKRDQNSELTFHRPDLEGINFGRCAK